MKDISQNLLLYFRQYHDWIKENFAKQIKFWHWSKRKVITISSLLLLLVTSAYLILGSSYRELEAIRLDSKNTLQAFSTDGCSGGMSASWQLFVSGLSSDGDWPRRLPWLACCLAHDESYWRGGSKEDRLLADRGLKQCVKNKGFPAVANLMYAAVRLGGGPCTDFSWRWGYGLPNC